jgi:hypothetical protein
MLWKQVMTLPNFVNIDKKENTVSESKLNSRTKTDIMDGISPFM